MSSHHSTHRNAPKQACVTKDARITFEFPAVLLPSYTPCSLARGHARCSARPACFKNAFFLGGLAQASFSARVVCKMHVARILRALICLRRALKVTR
jgi:hypothetical protein